MSIRGLPPEWWPQSGVLLTWPHIDSDWGPVLKQVEAVYTRLVRHISARQRVLLCVRDTAHREHVRARLQNSAVRLEYVHTACLATDDTWTRDYGPITVLENGRPLLLDFTFNGWGGKFAAEADNAVTGLLHRRGFFGATPLARVELVLEGGSIDTDGRGTLLTTERCLLTPRRNPGLDRATLAARLRTALGVQRVLWLRHGHLAGDDTDGHIDTLARFCDARTIAYTACDDPRDEHYDDLKAMEAELAGWRDPDNRPYRLLTLPWPHPKYDADGRRLPASYANFLIINGAVLVPTYDDPADADALTRLGRAFPDREIIAVPCLPLLQQNGSLHCVTMQLPKGVLTTPCPEPSPITSFEKGEPEGVSNSARPPR
ncbi:MAG TPA: agmatine deiminase family protein [Gammaproteobacteria bacterium]|nr:agmatine deiminase family protein [Gammaproteobacteria bacterium]